VPDPYIHGYRPISSGTCFLESILSLKKTYTDYSGGRFFVDLLGKSAIIIIAFSFFVPAFLFLLPSLRKKAGVLFYIKQNVKLKMQK
jgi:predicted transcriptional regulator